MAWRTHTAELAALSAPLEPAESPRWYDPPPTRYGARGWYWRRAPGAPLEYLGCNHMLAGAHLFELREQYGLATTNGAAP